MKVITTTVVITLKIPEWDPDGDPLTEQDEELTGVEVKAVQDGRELEADIPAYSDTCIWDLTPEGYEDWGLSVQFGHF